MRIFHRAVIFPTLIPIKRDVRHRLHDVGVCPCYLSGLMRELNKEMVELTVAFGKFFSGQVYRTVSIFYSVNIFSPLFL